MYSRALTGSALLLSLTLTSGCENFIHKQTMLGSHKILALDAQQRVIVEGKTSKGDKFVCAEPSPDAIAAQAASLGASLKGGLPPMQAKRPPANLPSDRHKRLPQLACAHKTIQLMRDGYYRLCEAALNGQISKDEYTDIVANIDVFMLSMLAIEQLGDKAFAGSNAAVAASAGSTVPANASGEPVATNVDTEINPVTGESFKIIKVTDNQEAEVALHKSRGIVEVMREYYKWKALYVKEKRKAAMMKKNKADW